MKSYLSVLLAAFTLLCGGAPVQATPVYITYFGTVVTLPQFENSGIDVDGLFGSPGANLAGLSYTAYFAFDVTSYIIHVSDHEYIFSGTVISTSSQSLGASLTINSITVSLSGQFLASINTRNDGGPGGQSSITHEVFGDDASRDLQQNIANYLGDASPIPVVISTAFSYTVDPDADNFSGYFITTTGDHLDLAPDRITVSLTAPNATPLPGALALFACGLGVIGLLARSRKRRAAMA